MAVVLMKGNQLRRPLTEALELTIIFNIAFPVVFMQFEFGWSDK